MLLWFDPVGEADKGSHLVLSKRNVFLKSLCLNSNSANTLYLWVPKMKYSYLVWEKNSIRTALVFPCVCLSGALAKCLMKHSRIWLKRSENNHLTLQLINFWTHSRWLPELSSINKHKHVYNSANVGNIYLKCSVLVAESSSGWSCRTLLLPVGVSCIIFTLR